MARSSNTAKGEVWKKRLARYEKSNRTVAEFCLDEGVSVPAFYYWRTKLSPRPLSQRAAKPASFQPVQFIVPPSSRQPTLIRLTDGTEIELGGDLAIVEAVIRQLLLNTEMTRAKEGASC